MVKNCALGLGSHITNHGLNPDFGSLKKHTRHVNVRAQNPDGKEEWKTEDLQDDHAPLGGGRGLMVLFYLFCVHESTI